MKVRYGIIALTFALSTSSAGQTIWTTGDTGHASSVNSEAFSPANTQLASGSWDRSIRLWDVSTGQEVRRVEGHSDWVFLVVFSPDGTRLVSGSDDGTIRLWNVATRQEIVQLDHKYPATPTAIPRNDNFIASVGGIAFTLWDVTVKPLEPVSPVALATSAPVNTDTPS